MIVTNFEFAMQEDIEASLADAKWSLLIVDEAHSVRGRRARFLQRLAQLTKQVVLASTPKTKIPEFCATNAATIVEWQSEPLDLKSSIAARDKFFLPSRYIAWVFNETSNGRQREAELPAPVDTITELIEKPPTPSLRRITFRLSPAEFALQATISELEKKLIVLGPAWKRRAGLLRRSSRSSPAALEAVLQTLVSPPEQGGITLGSENDRPKRPPSQLPPSIIKIATSALQQIDAIDRDSKLIALGELLADLGASQRQADLGARQRQKVGVLTDYSSTMYYLAADIEARGLSYYLLQADTEVGARARYLREFSKRGGTIVATTDAIADGFDSPEITDLVLYDLPDSGIAQRELLNRLNRPGSRCGLNAYTFKPTPGQEVTSFLADE